MIGQPFGVSFFVRAQNEAARLPEAIGSLASLRIPHEIVIVLHRCTDESVGVVEAIMRENPNVRYIVRGEALSRAGIENLVTPASSDHSFVKFSASVVSQLQYAWTFRYDADFVASPALIEYLNSREFQSIEEATRIRLPCRWDGISNEEEYLTNCLLGYGKCVFWESAILDPAGKRIHLQLPVWHRSPLSDVKPYWQELPWFLALEPEGDFNEARELAARYARVVELFGPEPVGMARASNPACDEYFSKVVRARTELSVHGISLYE